MIALRRFLKSPLKVEPCFLRRKFHNIQVPFQDDLSAADNDDFNLLDFQHYQESPDVKKKRLELIEEVENENILEEGVINPPKENPNKILSNILEDYVGLKEPIAFVSKISNPYRNLAIEDHIFNQMPVPKDQGSNYNRLIFYTNSPCVVIGKNQNPWKEVNVPLLNSLHIPLVRRKSGGGTVVHDGGNVNYSFMTTKNNFDRYTFAKIIRDGVNKYEGSKYRLEVNERGDITTEKQQDDVCYKISGSAYKLAKGKSYHHGTMLLNLRLDILKQLLHRDEAKLGIVDAMASVGSVKSKVTNFEMENDKFIELVTNEFQSIYGKPIDYGEQSDPDEYDQNELFGLTDFVEANALNKTTKVIIIDDDTTLPEYVYETESQLKEWDWKFGGTPRFSHKLMNEKFGFEILFKVDKRAIVREMELTFLPNDLRILSEDKIKQSFEFLQNMISKGEMKYKGSELAGFITNDMISDWLGESIDGTS